MAITVVGIGPAGLDRCGAQQLDAILDPEVVVVVRTVKHPAAAELAERRPVQSCDDLYDTHDDYDELYRAIVTRVLQIARDRDVVYGVPGSAVVGERSVSMLRDRCSDQGIPIRVLPGSSFLDLVYLEAGVDPIADGLQVVDARMLPDPFPLHLPTVITQVDTPLRAADVSVAVGRTLAPDHELVVLDRLGDDDQVVERITVSDLANYRAGSRTSVFIEATPVGLLGLVATNRVLRRECPWDREQTHHTLLSHLLEEAYEAADAIALLPLDAPDGPPDFGAYAEVEEELGDLLLQVVFHATLASETGAFDIDEVAETIRGKLVARHPHVFGDVVAETPGEVRANWERLKVDEKHRESLMDDIPVGMSGVGRAHKVQLRAASVGFDWEDPVAVLDDLRSEIDELVAADSDDEVHHEVGDILFAAINVARLNGVDPETALRSSVNRFIERFRLMEQRFAAAGRTMSDAPMSDLDAEWDRAKQSLADHPTTKS
ncbi:MAG: nucleoside triphosphate pyrophosphohydrolase [Acidimicrobiia bacterium]